MIDSTHEVVGYRTCRGCGDPWVLEVTWRRCSGCCSECFLAGVASSVASLEVEAEGRRMRIRRKPLERKGNQSPESARAAERARRRAKTRLSEMYPDVYEILLAQERSAQGLEPFPLERMGSSKTIDLSAFYDATHPNGVDAR